MPATNETYSESLVYTIPEAATALRISRTKLYELLDSGEIESIHIGRGRKIPADALRIYIDRLRASARSIEATDLEGGIYSGQKGKPRQPNGRSAIYPGKDG